MLLCDFVGVLKTAGGLVVALLALMAMVVIHEFGHFSTGKLLGFKINEFAIGFGKPIFKKKMKNGTDFSIRPIPLGGYCSFEGEDGDSTDEGAFSKQAPWKRLIVLSAGAVFNFISAIIIIALTFTFYGNVLPVATPISEGTGFVNSDIIMSVDGTRFSFFENGIEGAVSDGGKHVATLRRLNENGERTEAVVETDGVSFVSYDEFRIYAYYRQERLGLETVDPEGGTLEFSSGEFNALTWTQMEEIYSSVSDRIESGNAVCYQFYRVRFKFFSAFGQAFTTSFDLVKLLFKSFTGIFTGGTKVDDMGGPVSVISIMGESAQLGLGVFMYIVCMISANLAFFNLMPLPALDGSRIVFTLIEMIFRKPVPSKIEGVIHFVGFVLLFGFAILIDLLKVF